MYSLRRALPLLIIVGIYLLSTFLVNPRGEFPLNDDWSYTRSAFLLGTQNRLHVDEWSAMSLIGQAIYGGVLVKIFAPGFLLLRISTLVLSCCTALLIWTLLSGFEVQPALAWIAVLSWIFDPIQFCLAHTFMTEIPFLFFIALGLSLYALYLRSRSLWLLGAWSVALGYGFLIRQTALFFIGPMILALLLERNRQFRERVHRAALAALVFTPFAGGYYVWLLRHGGATPATQRKFELLRYLTSEQIVSNSLGTLFYLSFILFPMLIAMIPLFLRINRSFSLPIRAACLVFWTSIAVFGLWWFHARYALPDYLPSGAYHARMPFLLNVLYDTGLGPVTLDPTYYGPPATPVYPRVWLLISFAAALGTVILGGLGTLGIARLLSSDRAGSRRPLVQAAGLAVLGVAVFEVVFSHLQEGGLFDRHLLVSALPLCILLGLMHSSLQGEKQDKRDPPFVALAGIILLVSAWFSVTATHDYLAWNRVRWDLGTSLLARKVDPLSLSAGFEFNAWHNYDTFRARGNIGKVYYWWYDSRDYLISMRPEPGYRILQTRDYYSWLHRMPIPLYTLQKENRRNQ